MRSDHQLGIDAFVADAIRLSPNVTPIQALKLLQSCIKIMPKSGGNNRPVGHPGWFLLSASNQYFKRAWANTFDFLPAHWQNQLHDKPVATTLVLAISESAVGSGLIANTFITGDGKA